MSRKVYNYIIESVDNIFLNTLTLQDENSKLFKENIKLRMENLRLKQELRRY